MIEEISIHTLLPRVFIGMEQTERMRSSQLWGEPSFLIRRGCRICVQAESGKGKSSLLSFIYGVRNDYVGNILFDEKDIRELTVKQWCDIRIKHIAMLPQNMGLFPELSVIQNIELKNRMTNYKTHQEIAELLQRTGLAGKNDCLVGKLSIGQQQRVALVRAICQPFDFIFLDEPVSHLDERNNRIVAEIISEEAGKQGAGIIATSVGNPLLLDYNQIVSL